MTKYYVKSIALAAFLMAKGLPLIEVEKTDRMHLFWFENTQTLHECIDEFYSNEILRGFLKAQIKLKKIVFPKSTTHMEGDPDCLISKI